MRIFTIEEVGKLSFSSAGSQDGTPGEGGRQGDGAEERAEHGPESKGDHLLGRVRLPAIGEGLGYGHLLQDGDDGHHAQASPKVRQDRPERHHLRRTVLRPLEAERRELKGRDSGLDLTYRVDNGSFSSFPWD